MEPLLFEGGDKNGKRVYKPIGEKAKNEIEINEIDKTPKVEEEEGVEEIPEVVEEEVPAVSQENDGAYGGTVNFQQELEKLKKNNESQRPYTLTQVEDAMFVDKTKLVTLEYHYYQNNSQYIKLQEIEEALDVEGVFRDINDEKIHHPLGTENFMSLEMEPHHPMSAFARQKIRNYQESSLDILQTQKAHRNSDFMRLEGQREIKGKMNQKLANMMGLKGKQVFKDAEYRMVEGVVVQYNVTPQGFMRRTKEIELKMGRIFYKSQDGNMTLTRSTDKKLISIVNFNPNHDYGQYFKVVAFNALKLERHELHDKLMDGMNNYYSLMKDTFHKLIQVQFIGQCQYLMLTYVEKIEDKAAKKYVVFNATNGDLVFQYGGAIDDLQLTIRKEDISWHKGLPEDKHVTVYMLGILVKEIREEQFYSQLVLYYTGDFLNHKVKARNVIFKWGLQMLTIGLDELLQIGNEQDQISYIHGLIKQQVNDTINGEGIFFEYDPAPVSQQPKDWNLNIEVSANRKLDQFAIINNPTNPKVNKTFYLNGPVFKNIEFNAAQAGTTSDIEMPYFIKMPHEAILKHGRNAIIKDEIFYTIEMAGELNTFCLRMQIEDNTKRILPIKIPLSKYESQPDMIMHRVKLVGQEYKTEIFQTINVNKVDQYGLLQTRIPGVTIGKKASNYSITTRKTSQTTYENAHFPVLVHNLGDSKLIIDSLLRGKSNKKYILDMEPDQRFVGFVDFNHYEDIGFYPKGLNLECCSPFLFLTTSIAQTNVYDNKVNLLLVDPYHDQIQVAWFTSLFFYDASIFTKNDMTVKNIIQSNMMKKSDKKFKTYLWTQFRDEVIRSKLMRLNLKAVAQSEDSDEEILIDPEEDMEMQMNGNKATLEHVFMQNDEKDFIYYVQKKQGVLYLIEGNPRCPYISEHYEIWSLKANRCQALSVESSDKIYFMDDNYIIYKLTREANNRSLDIENELTIKEIQRLEIKTSSFDEIIIRERYLLYQSKIFYLFNVQAGPYPDGIFESEDLITDKKKYEEEELYVEGPKQILGSSRFFNVYTSRDGSTVSIKIFIMPDRTQKTLMNDFQNLVDMSSFLPDGRILVRCRDRFLLFNENAIFIDEVKFSKSGIEWPDLLPPTKSGDMTYRMFLEQDHIVARLKQEKLDQKKKEEAKTALDFKGNPYNFNTQFFKIEGRENIPMLLQMSQLNNHFLFYHKDSHQFFVYEMVERKLEAKKDTEALFQIGFKQQPSKKIQHEFVMKFELNIDDSYLFQYLYKRDIDAIRYFTENLSQIKIYNDGQVKMCYVQQLDKESEEMPCELVGAVFSHKEGTSKCEVQNFQYEFEFPKIAPLLYVSNILRSMGLLEYSIQNLRLQQSRLPRELHDYNQYDNILKEKETLEMKQKKTIFAKYYYEDLIIIYSGRFLQFGRLVAADDDHPEVNGHKMHLKFEEYEEGKVFKDINCVFQDTDTIIKIIETVQNDKKALQVIVRDDTSNILKIITWDFVLNMEMNILQLEPHQAHDVGHHIVKGMNYKMNYLINQDLIFDLEFNIPMIQQNVNQNLDVKSRSYNNQAFMINEFYNQSKIFWNGSKFLGIEKANCLFYSLNRMNVIYWRDIYALGCKPNDISGTFCLDWVNLNFQGNSLFHYFAGNAEVIKLFFNKFRQEQGNGTISCTEEYLPLQILNPDNQGKTALLRAVENQSPQSFECMVQLLFDYKNICLSKMMLKSLPLVLSHESQAVINYFEERIFCPPQMQIEQFVPWDPELEEVIFPCHTSIIWRDLLIEKLAEQGIGGSDHDEEEHEVQQASQVQDVEEQINQLLNPDQVLRAKKNKLRSLELSSDILNQGCDESLKRVKVEALDMDWVFYGDNAKTLLEILATFANNKALTTQSIKVFIDLMWSHYQMAIIKNIFIPFCVYLLLLSYLSATTIGVYMESFAWDLTDEEKLNHHLVLKVKTYVILTVASVLFSFFVSLEVKALFESGIVDYSSDMWNQMDMMQISFNSSLLVCFITNCYYEKSIYSIEFLRTLASFSNFLMWLKVFYWMRLFNAYAYYVKLIQQTIADSLPFMVMVSIIVCSFSNFFLIINKNQEDAIKEYEEKVKEREMFINLKAKADGAVDDEQNGDPPGEYIDFATGIIWMDCIIQVYRFGMLGDFDVGSYQQGYDKSLALIMFFLATYIIAIVFMNMLIAIMGDTFGIVLEESVENGLREQVVLIQDHLWLLDLKKIFHGQKYIMRVRPSASALSEENHVICQMRELEYVINKKIKNISYSLHKNIDGVDKQSQHLHKISDATLDFILRKIKNVEKVQDILLNGELEDSQGSFLGELHENLHNKKMELIDNLVPSQGQAKDDEYAHQVAMVWMQLADKNMDGMMNEEEFVKSAKKIEHSGLTDRDIRQMFMEFDVNGNGALSIDEMAVAVAQVFAEESKHQDLREAAHCCDDDVDAYGLETERD